MVEPREEKIAPIQVIARAVIYRDEYFLLVRRKGADYTFLPGGHVEFGESVLKALERELLEELGLPCGVGTYRGAVEHEWEERGRRKHEINHVFEVSVDSLLPTAPPASREPNLQFLWSRPDQLDAHNLRPPVLVPLLRAYSQGDRSIGWGSTFRKGRPCSPEAGPIQ